MIAALREVAAKTDKRILAALYRDQAALYHELGRRGFDRQQIADIAGVTIKAVDYLKGRYPEG